MIPGETIASGAPDTCPDCHLKLEPDVYQSAAGYYIGTWCHCGPYSRESGYYATREEATAELDTFAPRTAEFNPEGLTMYVQCPNCDGKPTSWPGGIGRAMCPTCQGTGWVKQEPLEDLNLGGHPHD